MDTSDANRPADSMMAVVTTGNGGYDKLDYRSVSMPVPGPGEVLLRVLAAGINNTDINTRLGWYSRSVTTGTETAAAGPQAGAGQVTDGGWDGATPFPLIQGADCCGRVVRTGDGVPGDLIGRRALVQACLRPDGYAVMDNRWIGVNLDGAFAEYIKVPADAVFAVDCDWTDAELATIPCAYGTAENMLHRAGLGAGDRVLVTGASGGVGSATVQLAKRRGATVAAITQRAKAGQLREIGADTVLDRGDDLLAALGAGSVDLVVDNVAGPGFPLMLKLLRRGGRYVSSGAIAGPVVTLDMRDLYLNDITLFGTTAWDEPVFRNVVSYIERDEIRPLLAKTFPLSEIAVAQAEFLQKTHVGNFVLIPPGQDA